VLPHVQFLHTNSSGAPEELTSHQGDVLWQARYKVWGNLALEEWRENVRNYMFVTPEQNLRFQGQYADAETGLHYNTFRYYDPDIGRFASQDPIGLAGGVNLYQYGPNPIGWIDPWGWVNRTYDKAGYHSATDNPVKSKAPINGQAALDNSIQVKDTSPRRVGVDSKNNEISILDRTRKLPSGDEIYHGHVRSWDALHSEQKAALIKAGLVNKKGKLKLIGDCNGK
jgi:RHS repeat-associated protein